MAQNLLKTERLHLEELKRYVASEADDVLAETQKGCADAEAEFYRTMSRAPAEGGALPADTEDVASLRREVQALAMEALQLQRENWAVAQGYCAVPRTQLEELLQLCESHVSGSGESSPAAEIVLEVISGLGEVLLEAERECEVLTLAVCENPGNDAQADRLRRLAAEGGLGQGPLRLQTLLGQLRTENESLRNELRRVGGPDVDETLAQGGNWPAVPEEELIPKRPATREFEEFSAIKSLHSSPSAQDDGGMEAGAELLQLLRKTALTAPPKATSSRKLRTGGGMWMNDEEY